MVAAAALGPGPPLPGPQGRPLLPALRHGAQLARGGAGLRGRRSIRRVYVRLPVSEQREPERRRGGGRLAARLDDDTVDADLARRGRRRREIEYVRARPRDRTRSWSSPAALAERVLGEGLEVLSARSPAPSSRASATRRRSTTSTGEDFGPLGHSVLLGDFVTTEDGTGLVHTALAFGEDDFRLGESYGMTLQNPVRLDGSFDERVPDFQGKLVYDHNPEIVEALRELGPPVQGAELRARLPALLALRHRAPLLREVELVRRAPPRSRTGCSPRTSGSAGIPSTSSTAASAAGSRTTSTGRSRASATGARRCRSGSAPAEDCDERFCAGSIADLRERGGGGPRGSTCTAPTSTRSTLDCEACGGRDAPRPRDDRRLVRLGRDAVRAVPLPVRERGGVRARASRPTSSARGSTRRAAGSTRSSPSRSCSSTRPTTATASASA